TLVTLVSRIDSVPSLPSLYFEVVRELEGPDPSLQKVGKIIARDAGMTAKISGSPWLNGKRNRTRLAKPEVLPKEQTLAETRAYSLSSLSVFRCGKTNAARTGAGIAESGPRTDR